MKIGDCSMNLKLHFKNIKHNPCCKIRVNNTELYAGTVNSFYNFDIKVDELVTVEIEHYDKKPTDTIVDKNGTIIDDRSFELEKMIVDKHDLQDLIWKSKFVATNGEVYKSCLFFGPNGSFTIQFTNPVLKWMLQHTDNVHDWEEDYPYYAKAYEILHKIND